METTISLNRYYATISICTLLACWGLFYLDHETKAIADLFTIGNLVALAIYFLPTFSICMLIFEKLFHKQTPSNRLVLSLLIGIPVGFTVVISAFLVLRPGI
jgi:RsiW-degrading membrane proteinase PrsW (M82 family)